MKDLKPFVKWVGGKSKLLPQLKPFFPETFNTYYEPFVGGGAVLLDLGIPPYSTINDYNWEVANLYSVVKHKPDYLMSMLDDFAEKFSEAFYYQLRAQPMPLDKTYSAARTVFLNKCGFNGLYRTNADGLFNVPFGHKKKCPSLYERKNILAIHYLLRQCTIMNDDFQPVINLAGPGDFVYCDPPYEPISKTSSFTNYCAGGFSWDDQVRLYESCVSAVERGATVIVSNSTSPRILELYKDWEINYVLASRSINCKADGRGAIRECVIVMKPS